MSIAAAITLSIGGVPIATGKVAGAVPALVAVDKLSVIWGRASLLDQPTPATATLTLVDQTGAFARRTDLKGKVVLIGWAAGSSSGYCFRGRVTDVDALPRTRGRAGFVVNIACSSKEVDPANWTAAEGVTWPQETAAARLNRIRALMPDTLFAGGIELPTRAAVGLVDVVDPSMDFDAYPLGPIDVGGKDALTLIRDLWRALAPVPLVYDPNADMLSFIRSRVHAYDPNAGGSVVGALVLVGGRYVVKPYTALALAIDAGKVPLSGPLSQPLESMVTRVEVKWWNTSTAAQATAVTGVTGAPAEADSGRRTLSVDTVLADSTKAGELANQWARLAAQVAAPNLVDPIRYRSDDHGGFADELAAGVILAGRERPAELWFGGAWITRLGKRPLLGVIGGQITYAGGEWDVQLKPAPVQVDAPYAKAVTANTSASSSSVTLAMVDDSVSVGDLEYVNIGAGYTISTQPWGA